MSEGNKSQVRAPGEAPERERARVRELEEQNAALAAKSDRWRDRHYDKCVLLDQERESRRVAISLLTQRVDRVKAELDEAHEALSLMRSRWRHYVRYLEKKYPPAAGGEFRLTCPHHKAIDEVLEVMAKPEGGA